MKKALAMAIMAVMMAGCAGDRYARSTGEVIDDAAIQTKVKTALVNDPEVKGMSINVDVDRGDVLLSGFADTPHEKSKAEDIAWGVKGVRSVKNSLELKQP